MGITSGYEECREDSAQSLWKILPRLDEFGLRYRIGGLYRGVEQSVAREAHNLKAAGSSPAPAIRLFLRVLVFQCNPLHSIEIQEN